MDTINNFLKEFSPPHPEETVIKNWLYPKGLSEQDIWNYYQKNKKNILNWIGDRPVAFFLKINDILVLKRNIKGTPIKLNQDNYDEIITGRTLQIFVEHPDPSNYFVVDIDAGEIHSKKDIQEAAKTVIELLKPLKIYSKEILFTSLKGLHVIGYLSKKESLDNIRDSIQNLLLKQDMYLVNKKGQRHKEINLDLTPNYKRSIHLCRFSLTKEGLICDNILARGNKAGHKIK